MSLSFKCFPKQYARELTVLICVTMVALVYAQPAEATDSCTVPTFSAQPSRNVQGARAIAIADFNNDGKLDIAVVNNRDSAKLSILLGDGTGRFSTPIDFFGGRSVSSLAAGDLNNDGYIDLVASNEVNVQGELVVWLGAGTGSFTRQPGIFLASGQSNVITSVALADLNGDTKLDAIVSSQTFNTVVLLLGDGTGRLIFSANISSGGRVPSRVLARDMNADGKLDLIIRNSYGLSEPIGNIAVLLGTGTGDFNAPEVFEVGTGPASIVVGDFNSDTKPDVALADRSSRDLYMFPGNGAGGLGPALVQGMNESAPLSMSAGDFNGDGDTDLVLFNVAPVSALVLLGNGTGAFTVVVNAANGEDPEGVEGAVADLDSDSRLDLVLNRQLGGTVNPLLNACGADPTAQVQFSNNFFATSENSENPNVQVRVTRTGDLTGMATVQFATSDGTAVAPGDYTPMSETLTFAPGEALKLVNIPTVNDEVTEAPETINLALTDVNGATAGGPATAFAQISSDDPTPIITASNASVTEGDVGTANVHFTLTLSNPSELSVGLNYATADGSATAGVDYQSVSGQTTFAPLQMSKTVVIPVQGDLSSEINETFLVNLSSIVNATSPVTQLRAEILDDDSVCPGPSFSPSTDLTGIPGPFALVSADLNNDGKRDVVAANINTNALSVLLGDGSGGFAPAVVIPVGIGPRSLAVADLNLDGKSDLVSANFPSSGNASSISVLLGDGAGNFAPAVTTSPVDKPVAIALGNLNPDGKPDLAVVSLSGSVVVLLGDGSGGFALGNNHTVGTSPRSVVLGDVNDDGKLDIVVVNQNSDSVSVLLGNGNGTFAPKTDWAVGANPQAVATADFNSDGKVDLAVVNLTSKDVRVLIGDGSGEFTTTTTLALTQRGTGVAVSDLNGDGLADLLATNNDDAFSNGLVSVFFGNGTGAFSARSDYLVGLGPSNPIAADLNSNSRPDIVVANLGSNSLTVFLNSCSQGPAQPTIRFGAANFSANESDLGATITVTRTGETSTSASIDYRSADGSALSTSDYTIASGTITFMPGEASKTFYVLLADDALVESNESLALSLSGPLGAILGTPNNVMLTVVDNDIGPSTSNPLDSAQFFVRQNYSDFLNREPDQGGWDYWTNQIAECGTNLLCVHQRRIGVSAAFFVELEFQRTGYVVYRMHRAAFGTWPNTTTRANLTAGQFMTDRPLLPEGADLAQSTINFANAFVQRPAFLQVYPASMTNADFVNQLFDQAELVPYTAERQQQIEAMNNSGKTRAQVLLDVIEIAEFKTREYNRSFVLMQYFGYLRRDPDQGGYDFWLNILNNREPNNYRSMVCGFITSAEYQQRFGTAITRTNADCAQ
jgi:hypothetical protein